VKGLDLLAREKTFRAKATVERRSYGLQLINIH